MHKDCPGKKGQDGGGGGQGSSLTEPRDKAQHATWKEKAINS